MQYGFVIDHRKCIGCHACTVACKSENDVPVGNFRTWVKYTEVGKFPEVKRHFAVLRCNHCTAAPCVTICPVNALEKRQDGIVDLDRDACIGCKACLQACPYDALYINEATGSAEKCHYCAHRVEQGLAPACEVVCPEEAIISGDLDDPRSRISRLRNEDGAVARRVEQGTGPNVFYLGAHPVTLQPGRAQEPPTFLWSERRLPAPDWPADREAWFDVTPDAVTVLDVSHDVPWGWKVSAYLVTKGIAAGAALLAPVLPALGAAGFAAAYAPELCALVFTAVTVVLLVADLKRPHLFFRLITRPNTKSWLVKGGWVLSAFAGLTALILALRMLGVDAAADGLRIPNALLGALTAAYTAWLFDQCEGRDFWQEPGRMIVHLLVQAVLMGSAVMLPFCVAASPAVWVLSGLLVAGAIAHFALGLTDVHRTRDTENGQQAASLVQRIPIVDGGELMAFRTGLTLTNAAATVLVVFLVLSLLDARSAGLIAVITAVGLFLYERARIRAAQLPPLS